jgi:hypothetical protein
MHGTTNITYFSRLKLKHFHYIFLIVNKQIKFHSNLSRKKKSINLSFVIRAHNLFFTHQIKER